MIKTVENFLKQYKIKNAPVIMGFSGGADSCTLALVLGELKVKYKLEIILAYFNHGWRKEEAKEEEKFTKNFAKKINSKFIIGSAPEGLKKTEEIAREARYAFFEECAKKNNTEFVFLAHNKNDNVETLVYRIIKGTSIKGLTSIPEQRDIYYRPLLNTERKDILEFLKLKKQEYMFDTSNNDTKYKRNLIRNKIFPIFEEINPNYLESIENLIKNSISSKYLMDEYIAGFKKKVIKKGVIQRQDFISLNKNIRLEILNNFLYDKLKYRNRANILKIDDFILNNTNSKMSLNKDEFIVVKNNEINIKKQKNSKSDASLVINSEGTFEFENIKLVIKKQNKKPKTFPKSTDKCCYMKLDFPLILRHRSAGDKFSPCGLKGTMKLKDYLINEKIPQEDKDNLILLCKGKEVCWILNNKLSEKFKVTDDDCYRLELV